MNEKSRLWRKNFIPGIAAVSNGAIITIIAIKVTNKLQHEDRMAADVGRRGAPPIQVIVSVVKEICL